MCQGGKGGWGGGGLGCGGGQGMVGVKGLVGSRGSGIKGLVASRIGRDLRVVGVKGWWGLGNGGDLGLVGSKGWWNQRSGMGLRWWGQGQWGSRVGGGLGIVDSRSGEVQGGGSRKWWLWCHNGFLFELRRCVMTYIFRLFKFTLKPPYTIAIGYLLLAVLDTSHWNFLSNLDSKQLETSTMTSCDNFWNMSIFGYSRAIWVFWPKSGVFRKSIFSWWRSNKASTRLGVLGGQVPRLYGGTIFGSATHLAGVQQVIENKGSVFDTFVAA